MYVVSILKNKNKTNAKIKSCPKCIVYNLERYSHVA